MSKETSSTSQCALITGASGYIGSKLAHYLCVRGWNVHIVTRINSDLALVGAIAETMVVHEHDGTASGMVKIVKEAQPDVVFHLASLFLAQHSAENLDALILSNVLFSTQLADAMAENGITHLVNTGTSWQHYEGKEYSPVNLYAATKQAFESILQYYVEARGLSVVSLALFDTYGSDDPRPKLISLLWKTALSGKPLAMSAGEQELDLVHIDDVLEAFLLASEEVKRQVPGHTRYGVGSNRPMTLKQVVAAFERSTGLTVPIHWGAREYRPREVMQIWDCFLPVPGWKPKTHFEVGIKSTRPTQSVG